MIVPKLTDNELVIMQFLWQQAESQQLSQIVTALQDQVSWSYKTYYSYLKNLVDKKAITFTKVSGNKRYFPLITRVQAQQQFKKTVKRLFSDPEQIIMSFVDDQPLTSADKEKLKHLIDQL